MTETHSLSQPATGYTEAEGYAASLRQQADWWDREKDCLDSDELRAAADFIDRLIRRVAALEIIIREELPPLSCACDANRMLVDDIHAAVGTP